MRLPVKQKGVAAVEFGILLVPLVILTFGITELGRAMYQYNTIAKATRDAARYMSVQTPGDTDEMANARCLAATGHLMVDGDCPGPWLVPELTDEDVLVMDSSTNPATHSLQPVSVGGGAPTGVANLVTVEVSGFQFVSLVSFVVPDIQFGTIGTTMFGPPPS